MRKSLYGKGWPSVTRLPVLQDPSPRTVFTGRVVRNGGHRLNSEGRGYLSVVHRSFTTGSLKSVLLVGSLGDLSETEDRTLRWGRVSLVTPTRRDVTLRVTSFTRLFSKEGSPVSEGRRDPSGRTPPERHWSLSWSLRVPLVSSWGIWFGWPYRDLSETFTMKVTLVPGVFIRCWRHDLSLRRTVTSSILS